MCAILALAGQRSLNFDPKMFPLQNISTDMYFEMWWKCPFHKREKDLTVQKSAFNCSNFEHILLSLSRG